MERVLITGGGGFIGSYIVNHLYQTKKYKVRVIDNFNDQIHSADYKKSFLYNLIEGKAEVINGDIRNLNDLSSAMKDVDYIIHLASETGTGQSMYELTKYTDTNITGTSNIFQVIVNEGLKIKKIILASSRSVYGEGLYICKKHGKIYPKIRNIEELNQLTFELFCPSCGCKLMPTSTSEDADIQLNSFYAFTKFTQEKLIETMSSKLGIDYTIFRYQNVYGAGQSLSNPYTGIISIFSNLLAFHKDLNIFEDGESTRDFVYVDDVAEITSSAIENIKTKNEVINVGTGESFSIISIANKLKILLNSNSRLNISGNFRLGDIRNNFADLNKFKTIYNDYEFLNINIGLQKFIDWFKVQKLIESNELYLNSLKELENKNMLIKVK